MKNHPPKSPDRHKNPVQEFLAMWLHTEYKTPLDIAREKAARFCSAFPVVAKAYSARAMIASFCRKAGEYLG